MQVLVILSAHEHRIETQPDGTRAPDGMKEWRGASAEHNPFEQVWAETSLHSETVSEIINGYGPPPDGDVSSVVSPGQRNTSEE